MKFDNSLITYQLGCKMNANHLIKLSEENNKLRENQLDLLKQYSTINLDDPESLDPIYIPEKIYYQLLKLVIHFESNHQMLHNGFKPIFESKQILQYQTFLGPIDILPKKESSNER